MRESEKRRDGGPPSGAIDGGGGGSYEEEIARRRGREFRREMRDEGKGMNECEREKVVGRSSAGEREREGRERERV